MDVFVFGENGVSTKPRFLDTIKPGFVEKGNYGLTCPYLRTKFDTTTGKANKSL